MKLLFILLLGLGFSQNVTQRTIDLTIEGGSLTNISEIFPDYDLDWAILKIVQCPLPERECFIEYPSQTYSTHKLWESGGLFYYNSATSFWTNPEQDFVVAFGQSGPYTMKLLVTAEFPEEDTGYIEEGYQFCVQPGANLLSFPCDNPISVNQSLPQGAENFINQIVGQGVAATYNPALGWVGSLDNFSPGSGYWFKSNESLCFEYDCVED